MLRFPIRAVSLPNRAAIRISVLVLALVFQCGSPVMAQAEESPNLKWVYSDIYIVLSSPVIGPDSTVYVGSNYGGLYAIRPDGTLKWKYETRWGVESTPAIGADGLIYFGDTDGTFHAITPQGSLRWSYRTGASIRSSPAIGNKGCIYVGSKDGFVYAFHPNGKLQWRCRTGTGEVGSGVNYSVESPPVVGPDGTIYVASKNSRLYAITPYGACKWVFTTSYANWDAAPAVGADGVIYYGSKGNVVYAINPNGTLRWNHFIQGAGYSSPAVAADGSIYLGTSNGELSFLYALNPDGTEKWRYKTGAYTESSPAIGSDGAIYVGCDDQNLYILNPDGSLRSRYFLKTLIHSCPALAPDGTVYASTSGGLFALQTDNRGYQSGSPWPAFTFSPTRSVMSGDITEPALYTMRGQVAMPDSTPLVDVEVSAEGLTTRTDDYGFYSFSLPDGSYTLFFYVNSTVIPDSVEVRVNGSDVYVDLHPPSKHLVRGRVLGRGGPFAGMGILVESETAVTDSRGWFSFLLPDGEYMLEFDAGEQYFPSARGLTVSGADVMLGDILLNRILWSFAANELAWSSPWVGGDGTTYLITGIGIPMHMYALYPDGKLRGKYDFHVNNISISIQGADGTLYIAAWEEILALNPDLTLKWTFPFAETGAYSDPTLDTDGVIYFGSYNRAYALNPDGTVKWKYSVVDRVVKTTISGKNGIIYFTCEDGAIYGIDPNGILREKYENGEVPDSGTTTGPENTVTYSCRNGILSAIRPDGTVNWTFPDIDDWTYAWVYPPTGEIWTWQGGYPIGLNPDGTLKWRHRAPWGTPASGPDGRIYATYVVNIFPRTTYLYAIDMVDPDSIKVVVASDGAENTLDNSGASRPEQLHLYQNRPNPFNPETTIEFSISKAACVTVEVYTASGQLVRRLADTGMTAGSHRVTWNGAANASGVYLVRVRAGNEIAVGKMLMMK